MLSKTGKNYVLFYILHTIMYIAYIIWFNFIIDMYYVLQLNKNGTVNITVI